MYAMLLSASERHRYATAPPEVGTCLAVPGSPPVAEMYSWLLVVGDLIIAPIAYVKYAFQYDWVDSFHFYGMWQVGTAIWIRAAVLAASSIHLSCRAHWHKWSAYARQCSGTCARQSAWLVSFEVGRVVCCAGFVIAISAAVNKIFYQYAILLLGHSIGCIAHGSQLQVCMESWTKTEACSEGVLNWTVPGNDVLQMDYSYADEFWSMMDFGPVRSGCLRASDVPPAPA